MDDDAIRDQVGRLLQWADAHVDFDKAIARIPPNLRGKAPAGLPYSPWQLLEHLRLAQHDILEFCVNARYKEPKWPDEYWPQSAAPPSDRAWDESIQRYRADRTALQELAANRSIDLTSRIPHGQGQTYLRELVLAADHAAYHVGELVVVRRLLGIW
jgi:hypothetical protein